MKYKIKKIIATILIAALTWQNIAGASQSGSYSLRPLSLSERDAARTSRLVRFLRKLVSDEREIIVSGFKTTVRALAAIKKYISDPRTALKSLPIVGAAAAALYGCAAPATNMFNKYMELTRDHPWLTAVVTTACLTGFLAELISLMIVGRQAGEPPRWYRLLYKSAMLAYMGAQVKLFYVLVDTIPATGAYPELKILVDMFGYTPVFGFSVYYTFLNLFEYAYKKSVGIPTTEMLRDQLPLSTKWNNQVYQALIRCWPIWIPAHHYNYYFLNSESRIIFVNVVSLLFQILISVLDKTLEPKSGPGVIVGPGILPGPQPYVTIPSLALWSI
ncbi:MAG: Mpv17/PMP22 family protein [Candidatus Omnitrophota bacterium]